MTTLYSIIIPVFNRPGELGELLESLKSVFPSDRNQEEDTALRTEIIVVDDGSSDRSETVCHRYRETLNVHYIYQENGGPGAARNTGARSANGSWLIFFDSDCVIPPGYLDAVEKGIATGDFDIFGGPDRASADFSPTQKAIDYAMTSFMTTGGIRGGKKKLDRFYPRSFNMGVRKNVFDELGGFSTLRFGEDLDLSMRLLSAGYRSALLEEAWVYHKRRTDLKKFFKQVYNSGMARVVLQQRHPGTMKAVHLMPSLFVLYILTAFVSLPFLGGVMWAPAAIYLILLFIDGMRATGQISAALMVPPASLAQLGGYGIGLLHAWIKIRIFGRKEARAFDRSFYR